MNDKCKIIENTEAQKLFSSSVINKNLGEYAKELINKYKTVDLVDSNGRSLLMWASLSGEIELVNYLISNKVDPNLQDDRGFCALHFAIQEHNVEVTSALVKAGANLELKDRFGNTPLMRAVLDSRGRGDIIRILLLAGADKNATNNSGNSPIDLARTISNFNVIQFFT